jgi:hypothetical protein
MRMSRCCFAGCTEALSGRCLLLPTMQVSLSPAKRKGSEGPPLEIAGLESPLGPSSLFRVLTEAEPSFVLDCSRSHRRGRIVTGSISLCKATKRLCFNVKIAVPFSFSDFLFFSFPFSHYVLLLSLRLSPLLIPSTSFLVLFSLVLFYSFFFHRPFVFLPICLFLLYFSYQFLPAVRNYEESIVMASTFTEGCPIASCMQEEIDNDLGWQGA